MAMTWFKDVLDYLCDEAVYQHVILDNILLQLLKI